MNRPTSDQKCSGCKHPFGSHFETYDGSQIGCKFISGDQREPYCNCLGFTIAWRSLSGDSPLPTYTSGVRPFDK